MEWPADTMAQVCRTGQFQRHHTREASDIGGPAFVIVGLMMRAIATAIHREPQPGGELDTFVGVVGASVGGLIAAAVGGG